MDEIDTFDIFNVEYNDNILDTYYKIVEYCDPMYVNIHNNSNYGAFFEVIYRNVDVYNSSKIIKRMKKNESNLELDDDENCQLETYEYN